MMIIPRAIIAFRATGTFRNIQGLKDFDEVVDDEGIVHVPRREQQHVSSDNAKVSTAQRIGCSNPAYHSPAISFLPQSFQQKSISQTAPVPEFPTEKLQEPAKD